MQKKIIKKGRKIKSGKQKKSQTSAINTKI